ncbi:hypothetical protein Ccrd_004300 [Cynara cardunculus var. scolymus]|uniref:Uncharacterized protein n=1 Tax=Cynara cardunculus var. scolymus TaxID=59895 RepID=A0A103XMR4_CYNCS|nr:hypothetical protein Ccrd_004300 [Cynara cardunculus var. scolymus]
MASILGPITETDIHKLQEAPRSRYWKAFNIWKKEQQRLDVETEERKKKIRKFKESTWKCVYYLSVEILVLVVTHDEPWFTNTMNFWTGLGSQQWPDQKAK